MTWYRAACTAAVLLGAAMGGAAQAPQPGTGSAGDPAAVRRGSLLFRARCAGCHGLDARGVSGPDLTMVLSAGTSDERFFRILRNGLGTEMPRFSEEQTTDVQVREILAYLQMLTRGTASEPVRGNAGNGAAIFQRRCASCHKVNGNGGSLGPDLSRIGAMRSASALAAKIRDPNRSFVRGYRPATVVLTDGRRVRGVVKNQDAFSIQIMDVSERLQGFPIGQLREVVFEPRSPMPVFGPAALNDSDMNDLLSYLATLRGAAATLAQ